MSRQDFVTVSSANKVLEFLVHTPERWWYDEQCEDCEAPFVEGSLGFYLDDRLLCWGCAPPAAKVFAQAQYRVYNDPDPARWWPGGSVLEHGCAIDESFDAAAIGASV